MDGQTGKPARWRHPRRLLAPLAALVLVTTAACGDDSGDGGGGDRPLRIWVRQAEDGGLPTYRQMAELYEEATGQEIELYGEVTGFE